MKRVKWHALGAAIGALLGVAGGACGLLNTTWGPAVGAFLGGMAPLVPRIADAIFPPDDGPDAGV